MFNVSIIILNILALLASYGSALYMLLYLFSLLSFLFCAVISKTEYFENLDNTLVIKRYSLISAGILNIIGSLFGFIMLILMGPLAFTLILSPLALLTIILPFANVYYCYYRYTRLDFD
jgi:hypothetical protein